MKVTRQIPEWLWTGLFLMCGILAFVYSMKVGILSFLVLYAVKLIWFALYCVHLQGIHEPLMRKLRAALQEKRTLLEEAIGVAQEGMKGMPESAKKRLKGSFDGYKNWLDFVENRFREIEVRDSRFMTAPEVAKQLPSLLQDPRLDHNYPELVANDLRRYMECQEKAEHLKSIVPAEVIQIASNFPRILRDHQSPKPLDWQLEYDHLLKIRLLAQQLQAQLMEYADYDKEYKPPFPSQTRYI